MINAKTASLKKVLTVITIALLYFIVFIISYLLISFLLAKIAVGGEQSSKQEIEIHILTNGVHTDIVVPANTDQFNWFKVFTHIDSRTQSAYKQLAIGWGDKGFYLHTPTWADLKASVALKAVLGLSGTAVHATYYKGLKESASCKKILISKVQYQQLIDYILTSLDKNDNDHFIEIETALTYNKTDAFYEAKGRYHLFNTCNSWANRGLKICEQKACLWTPFQ